MNRRAIVALLLTTTAFAEPPTASPRNVIPAAVAKKNPIGGVLWIENAGTSEVILEGNRTASLTPEPLTADTIFDVASLTKVVATTPNPGPDGSLPQDFTETDLAQPVAILVGTEKYGLSDFWLNQADLRVRIPMLGRVNSLNVATSAALLIYEAVKQRRRPTTDDRSVPVVGP